MKTLLVTLILALILMAVAILLLGVKVLFVRGGKFPSGHAHDVMRKIKKNNKSKSQ